MDEKLEDGGYIWRVNVHERKEASDRLCRRLSRTLWKRMGEGELETAFRTRSERPRISVCLPFSITGVGDASQQLPQWRGLWFD